MKEQIWKNFLLKKKKFKYAKRWKRSQVGEALRVSKERKENNNKMKCERNERKNFKRVGELKCKSLNKEVTYGKPK